MSAQKKNIALIGNPNCGKTTLFNSLTGSRQRIGNWPGVTVEKKEGSFTTLNGDEMNVVDLPGIYSLAAQSEDERVARDYLVEGNADLVINIIDGTNLERNLFLTLHLLEMGVPVVAAITMKDLAVKKGMKIEAAALSQALDIPAVLMDATDSADLEAFKASLPNRVKAATEKNHGFSLAYPEEVEALISRWQPALDQEAASLGVQGRWLALQLMERDDFYVQKISRIGALTEDRLEADLIEMEKNIDNMADVALADAKFQFIQEVAAAALDRKKPKASRSDKIDSLALHRVFGIPLFLGVMYLMFWLVMTIGGSFIDFFDILFGAVFVDGLGLLLVAVGTPEWLTTILASGVGAGIQTVATFIPPVFFMFFFLSILEDSGYMARAAFVMDRLMRFLGLPGKAFIPMLVGFGCTVPAIMATRTLENKKDRFMTIFMSPLMSCGARMPVYALFAAAFFPHTGGLVVFSIYLVGIVLAVLTGLLLKKTILRGQISPFVMELPPYHAPRMGQILTHTWNRLKIFLFRAGKVVILAVALLGVLNSIGTDGSFGNEDSPESIISAAGKAITPVFTPMGIEKENWPATVGLFTGLFAKEAVVGTVNGLYGQIAEQEAVAAGAETEEEEPFSLGGSIAEAFLSIPEALGGALGGLADPFGTAILGEDTESVAEEIEADLSTFTILRERFTAGRSEAAGAAAAYAYLLFILIYFPCLAALGAIVREAGKFYGWLSVVYLTLLGWITATLFYQIAAGHRAIWIVVPLGLIGGIILMFNFFRKREEKKRHPNYASTSRKVS